MKLITIIESGAVNFVPSKIPVEKSTIFPHRSIKIFTWTSPDGNTTVLIKS
jgi:hypothetical protein